MSAIERVRSAWLRAKTQLRRGRLERDLEDELRFHVSMREQQCRAAGLGPEAARQAARRRFGNTLALREACRDVWTFPRLETVWQDLRLAGRVLWRSPGFTAAAVVSLALGIGGNAATFSLVSAILLRPLPYPAAERLVRLTGSRRARTRGRRRGSEPEGAHDVRPRLTPTWVYGAFQGGQA